MSVSQQPHDDCDDNEDAGPQEDNSSAAIPDSDPQCRICDNTFTNEEDMKAHENNCLFTRIQELSKELDKVKKLYEEEHIKGVELSEKLEDARRKLEQKIEEIASRVFDEKELSNRVKSLEQELRELKKEVARLRAANAQPVLLWRIPSWKVARRRTKVSSPVFSTQLGGFGHAAKLRLESKDTEEVKLGVQFVEQPQDAHMQWPFPHELEARVVGQGGREDSQLSVRFSCDGSRGYDRPAKHSVTASNLKRLAVRMARETLWLVLYIAASICVSQLQLSLLAPLTLSPLLQNSVTGALTIVFMFYLARKLNPAWHKDDSLGEFVQDLWKKSWCGRTAFSSKTLRRETLLAQVAEGHLAVRVYFKRQLDI